MQKTKALNWIFSREYQKSGKAGRFLFFGGVDAQEIPGGKPEVWLALPSELLPHKLVTGGIPHAGSQQTYISWTYISCTYALDTKKQIFGYFKSVEFNAIF